MKIDRSRLKKCTSEVPPECQALISKLRSCSQSELLEELKQIDAWTFGKCELFHWIDVLDLTDSILEEAATKSPDNPWELACDLPQNREAKELLLWVLHFTTLLIEHSFSRHLYNSMEHLVTLLSSCDMHVVLGVLNLLYMFSKRSNFITRLNSDKRQALLSRLNHLAESWGGKENGFGLADCCKENPEKPFPASSTTLHFEFYAENTSAPSETSSGTAGGSGGSAKKTAQTNLVTYIHIENVDKLGKTPAQIMNDLLKVYNVPQDRQMALFTHIRLAHSFSDYRRRLQCVQARLQALSVLVYSNALQENAHSLLHAGLLEELVELLELPHPHLVEIRAAALRTLTSIIHLDRNPHHPKKSGSRLKVIIDVTGASSYHGFLPVLVRTCITSLTSTQQPDGQQQPFPLPLATALFSFLYHLANYEAGGEALVSCGMMESLLKVINWPGKELEHITFVTRAVRVIDLITNIDMQGFQAHNGLASFIKRLDMEVNVCRKEQPFEIEPEIDAPQEAAQQQQQQHDDAPTTEESASSSSNESQRTGETVDEREESPNQMELSEDENTTSSKAESKSVEQTYRPAKNGKTCLPQRAALLKSMLNFLKKAIQDPMFSDSIRHIMEGTLPSSLKHIISNSEYYGPSLFLLATDVVTVYVFQEPSLLSTLQDNGLTDVVLHALLNKDVPATREVLGSLPNVFSALCLNQRGLASFMRRQPFDRIFKVLLSPVYLSAMRRRRSADPLGDTATNLGNAMDELMRHQPSLKTDAMAAIVKLLQELCVLGCDSRYVCWRAASKTENSPSHAGSTGRQASGQSVGVGVGDAGGGTSAGGGSSSSDEEDEDEEEASTSSHPQREEQPSPSPSASQSGPPPQPREKTPIALVDYIHNAMKFVDAILSNNSTDDHCREFVAQKGLVPLLSILGLPNLPVDYPVAQAAQAVASVCKSILNLAHEPLVLKTGLQQLNDVLELLKPLHSHMQSPNGSVLLHELACAPTLETAFTSDKATPLLHAMNAAHGYVVMFVHVCRTSQSEIRNLSMNHWGSELGLAVLKGLSELYMSLVWESTLLLALCSDDSIPPGCDFGKEDMEKLLPPELRQNVGDASSWPTSAAATDLSSNGMTTAMEALSTDPPPVSMEVDESKPSTSTAAATATTTTTTTTSGLGRLSPNSHQLKYIKPLLAASSRLGRALAELFGLLVKLCMGSPTRQRRGQQLPPVPTPPSQAARSVATALNCLLMRGLSHDKLPPSPVPKFKLTFLICSVGFTSPMLFDEKRHPYHLMLQKFVKLGGQSAFFSTFEWALSGGGQFDINEGLEHPDLPDGTGEFLDVWLMLLEKMVNPKAILDSPHVVSTKCTGIYKSYEPFDPIKYLIDIHKKAFKAVMLMWGKKPLKNYGPRMTESILSILRHILQGEKIIKERTEKQEASDTTNAASSNATSSSSASGNGAATAASRSGTAEREPDADVNPEHLRQLMDMGFSRAHCVEALLHTMTVEQATDYLLTNPATLRRVDIPGADLNGQGLIMDLEMGDEDQVMQAIAMSLDESEPQKPEPLSTEEQIRETSTTIDEFTKTALAQCLGLLDQMPDTVYRICDLLVTITKRNGIEWRDSILKQLITEIGDLVDFLHDVALSQDENAGSRLVECEEANKVAGRIYLYTLFFEGNFQEMRVPCALVVEQCGLLDKLVRLLVASEVPLTASKNKLSNGTSATAPAAAATSASAATANDAKDTANAVAATTTTSTTATTQPQASKTPKWLAPLLLLIDRLEKVAVLTQRKVLMHRVTSGMWRWFDLSSGKWTPYSNTNNRAIDKAYWAGEPTVRINCSRRRYLITFSCMTQVNEDSDNRRPITRSFKRSEETTAASAETVTATATATLIPDTNMDTEENATATNNSTTPTTTAGSGADNNSSSSSSEESKRNYVIQGLDPNVTPSIVRACVKLLAIPVDRDALHALMKVCLRLTRDYKNAEVFAREGGVKLLLDMTQASSFIGSITLSTLLIRHTLEEPLTLGLAMEKVVRSRTQPNIPPPYKEILFMTRQISSAVCRDPEVYRQVCENILRVDVAALKRDDEDNRLIVKALPPSVSASQPMAEEVSVNVIHELLNALIKPVPVLADEANGAASTTSPGSGSPEKKSANGTASAPSAGSNNAVAATSSSTTSTGAAAASSTSRTRGDLLLSRVNAVANATANNDPLTANDDDDQVSQIIPLKMYTDASGNGNGSKVEPEEAKKPLLPKSAILKMLAEAVRSYGCIANLITEYSYRAGQSEMVQEDTTALAFVLDRLLPVENTSDRQCSSTARMLIAALASCNHSPEAQSTLVAEVKAALTRTLALPESSEKHSQLQLLIGLISTMIDSCPPSSQAAMRGSLKLNQYTNVNYIVRLMLKKGIITDLAKIPHSLDLSSPNMAATINAALKPLETLSRIINQPMPGTLTGNKFPKPKSRSTQEEPTGGERTGTTTSDATNAVGEETNEDAENTEHDISVNAESLEPTSESQQHEEGDEAVLDDIMDQLLERDTSAVSEEPTSRLHRPMDIEGDSLVISRMRDGEGDYGDPARDTTEDLMSSDSDSDNSDNPSDDNEDDVQDDDDDEEDDEEEDDADDGEEDNEDEEEEEDGEEESSNYEEDGMQFYHDMGEDLLRMVPAADRDSGNVVMIQHNFDNPELNVVPTSRQSLGWNSNPSSFAFDLGRLAADQGDLHSHPRIIAEATLLDGNRSRRSMTARGYRVQLSNSRNANPPVILQRLLGPAGQSLPLAASQILATVRDTRVVVMDNGLGIMTNQDDEPIDLVDQSGYLFGPSLAATLNNIPTALHWWIEESRLLDGDSQPDCCVGVVYKLIPGLEKYRNAELAERKEKLKKQQEAAQKEAEKNKEAKGSTSASATENEASNTPPSDEQRATPSTSVDSRQLMAAVEAVVEAVRQELTTEEEIIGEMEVADEEDRPPPPHDEQQANENRESQLAQASAISAATQIAERFVNSVLSTAASEVSRIQRQQQQQQQSDRPADGSSANENSGSWTPSELVDFSQNAGGNDPNREGSSLPIDWIRRLLTEDSGERNANVSDQDSIASAPETANDNQAEQTTGQAAAATAEAPQEQNASQQQQQQAEATSNDTGEAEGAAGTTTTASSSNPEQQGASASEATSAQDTSRPQSANQAAQEPFLDGVDPSFLAALPEDMRDEVIAEQLRLQRIRQRAQSTIVEELSGPVEVNPEFLAALPPAIQEEVLAQQRLEQQRHAAASANPEDPVDAAAFFQNLQPSLRQAILTDMEESQISVLPPDLAQEAQNLRREWEARNRHIMQERFLNHVSQGNHTLSSILRTSGRGRGSGTRYAIHAMGQRAQWNSWNNRGDAGLNYQGAGANMRMRGRQLLDHESMACLLVLLFIDEPKINTLRLHRVIRNLCYHGSTREWIVKALLNIMERSNDENRDAFSDFGGKFKRKGASHSGGSMDYCSPKAVETKNNTQSWLNISIDAALGCKANVFHILRHGGKKSERQGHNISIHPQAAPTVCRHTLDLMISLAKSFPGYFVPLKSKEAEENKEKEKEKESTTTSLVKEETGAKPKTTAKPGKSDAPDFWDMLLRLDSCASKKGKSVARTHSTTNLGGEPEQSVVSFEMSSFGQLISMLSWSVIRRSSQLTDKLLRLLSLISIGLTEVHPSRRQTETTAKNKKSPDAGKEGNISAPESHIRLAVQVLTSKSCSEEGLEDATALLLNLSHCPDPTRQLILKLLLEGAMELANMVCDHINDLMMELKVLNREYTRRNSLVEEQPSTSSSGKGVLMDRFTSDNVVIVAPTKLKAGSDLQLPTMGALVSKTSSQAFFLRILKVIVQIREAVRHANSKWNSETNGTEAPAAGAAEAAAATTAAASVSASSDTAMETAPSVPSTGNTAADSVNATSNAENNADATIAMDTTTTTGQTQAEAAAPATETAAPGPSSSSQAEEDKSLPLLSESLVLDNLWETLSACLLELEHTPDHHAVLVLQPAVEAFFLVHSSSSTSRERSNDNNTEHVVDVVSDIAPVSPIYADNDAVSSAGAGVAPVAAVAPAGAETAPASTAPTTDAQQQQQQPDIEASATTNAVEGQQQQQQQQSSATASATSTPAHTWDANSGAVQKVLPPDQLKFLKFAETHRTVLNQILRQTTTHLADGPFSVLVDHTRVLDFDVKRRYFRTELERMDEGIRREELAVHVRRSYVFEDSFRELHRRTADEWKNRFYIVFEGEEGQDAGGLLREWYVIISREIFNPMYALFTVSPGDRVTYMINSSSHCNPNHLCYYKFVGRVIAKAIYDNKLLECYFTRSFYKHILGILVKHTDMESEDYSFYKGLVYLTENNISELGYELTFSAEVNEFGVNDVRDLIPNGRNIVVTEENKLEYIRLVCQMKMTGAIRKQLTAFLEGFYDIIPKRLISIFNEQELELLISGLPNVDIEDLKANTEYHKYSPTSLQIQWFWRALRGFDQADRAKFLQFVTGTSKVPLQGFGALEGMNGVQKFQIHRDDRSTDRLPSAHTCFNQLDLPVYETYDKLRSNLLKAIHECSEGFGFA